MTVARLVATLAAPLPPSGADAPELVHGLLVQRGDTELVALDPGVGREVRFPAPWPRGLGAATLSPHGDFAVFAGLHAVRAVDPAGDIRWEMRHACWGGCDVPHASAAEYLEDEDHEYPDHGSAAVSGDGKLVWAHVREPDGEAWLVLDAVDGRVLGRAETGTVASGSFHTAHPDPTRMHLSIGEGEEGSPVLSGRWDGRLSVTKVDDELVALAVSPSGLLLTVDVTQETLSLHDEDGSVLRELDATGTLPPGAGSRVYWDLEAAFADESTVIVAGAGNHPARHWLLRDLTPRGEVTYPFPVTGPPRPAGDGAWYTVAEDGASVHLWAF
ncbi:hypothetical protein ACFWQL_28345 [Amycolatopsis thermoflava]|uniref:hypothetical protein n=1 Tax=Amycolatopsis thermoflava TaxID=84480 RepID=UPI003651FECA